MKMKTLLTSCVVLMQLLFPSPISCMYDCIRKCACQKHDDVLIADCKGLQLTEAPEPNPQYEINVLYLQYNRISRLRTGGFSLYGRLKELYIQGNKIYAIEEDAFDGLGELERLDISKNMINKVPENDWKKLKNLQWLSISMNALQEVPKGLLELSQLKELDLSTNNFIRDIPAESFPASLVKLDLRYVAIRKFKKDSFDGLVKLKTLLLSDNKAAGSVQFEKGAFDGLVSLEHMDMSRCFCRRLPSDSFVKLNHLRTLLLKNSYLSQPPLLARTDDEESEVSNLSPPSMAEDNLYSQNEDAFTASTVNPAEPTSQLTSSTSPSGPQTTNFIPQVWFNPFLTILDLSNNRKMSITSKNIRLPPLLTELRLGYTNIVSVDDNLFNETLDIQKLDLCHTKLRSISKNAFMKFRNVSEICLSANPFTMAPRLPSSLLTLNFSETKITNLTKVILKDLINVKEADLRNGEIEWIEDFAFKNMTSMKKLDLEQNKLDTLSPHTLHVGYETIDLKLNKEVEGSSVTEINLSHNMLRRIYPGALSMHHHLRYLDMKGNFLEAISLGMFEGLQSLVSLDISENLIVEITPNAFTQLQNLEVLNLNHNSLEIIFSGTFNGLTNLKRLNLQMNKIMLVHPFSIATLEFLDISNNNLTEFPQVGGENLRDVSAAYNEIDSLSSDFMKNNPKLEEIDLSHCKLGYINYSVFQQLPSLRSLDLTDNSISQFLDEKLPTLEVLNLRENEIRVISNYLSKVGPNIRSLDMSYNNITHINPNVFLGSTSLSSVDFIGNNFQCNCELLPFVEWVDENMHDKKVDVVDAPSYLCEGPEEQYTTPVLIAVLDLNCDNPIPPQPQRAKIYTIGICAGVVLILVVIVIFMACGRRSRRPRTRNENGEEILNQNGDSEVISSPRGCCMPCKKWCLDMNDYKYERGQRGRIVSEERRDLMVSSPATSPTETQPPISL